ncbi:RICIN domain-containing protein [Aequorivita sublithincola]|uniref:RICIN domain-containing protein n=1 Tax=Aequorivita sublithincola TaxID=101385 RepID=UPI0012FA188D|nr:hypothetical protein [Aequorivita sublithincola]
METGLVLDVQGNVKENGTKVWPFSINYGLAQVFQVSAADIPDRFGSDVWRIMPYDKGNSESDLYISVKAPAPVVLATPTNTTNAPIPAPPELIAPSEVMSSDIPSSTKKTLKNLVFTLEEKREFENSTSPLFNTTEFILAPSLKQLWKIVPVENEQNIYFIESVHFSEKMVIEPLDRSSGGTLVLSSFTGSNLQKWKITRTKPTTRGDLKLTNFKWERTLSQEPWYKPWKWHYVYKIKGKLTWSIDNSLNVTKQTIRMTNSTPIDIAPNRSIYEFDVKSEESFKTDVHCFVVAADSKWTTDNRSLSDPACGVPAYSDPSTTRPPVAGVGKLLIRNCHNDKKSVRLWTYDLTVNSGQWKDNGTLDSQWQGSNCGSAAPKEITIKDNHIYLIAATDCGNSQPPLTQSSCDKLAPYQFQGKENGTSLTFQID